MKKARTRSRPAPTPSEPPRRSPERPTRSAGWFAAFGLTLAILGAPCWLAADPLGGFRWNDTLPGLASQVVSVADPLGAARLTPDDAAFLAASRTGLRRSLPAPADGQVVPLFRLLTWALTQASGNLARLATVLTLASYAALFAAVGAVGHVVAREDRSLAPALAAMAGLAASSVLEPATAHYAASRGVWAGLAVLAMLVTLQGWRTRAGAWRLAVALAAAAAAPLFGPGGLAAGPAGLAYLLADGRPRCRKAAALPLLAAGLTGAVSLARGLPGFHPVRGALDATRAVPEVLVFQNLGLDVPTGPAQGVVFVLALAAAWAWSRSAGARAWPRPNPLEASGATLAAVALWLGLSANGGAPRDAAAAVPQVGAVLFAAGWWSGQRGTGRDPSGPVTLTPPTRREALAVLALLAGLCVVETPRFRRLGQARVYPLSPVEVKMFPIPTLHWWRAKFLADELAERQERFLDRLDRAEARCRALGIGPGALRRAFGRVAVPGLSGRGATPDAIDLLALPETGRTSDPASVRVAVGSWLTEAPEPRPGWLPPGAPWPPGGAHR